MRDLMEILEEKNQQWENEVEELCEFVIEAIIAQSKQGEVEDWDTMQWMEAVKFLAYDQVDTGDEIILALVAIKLQDDVRYDDCSLWAAGDKCVDNDGDDNIWGGN